MNIRGQGAPGRVAKGAVTGRIARVGVRRHPRTGNALPPPPPTEDPTVAAARAGARGWSAPGVDYVDRLSHYQTQNGPPYRQTARQERRMRHKAHHQEAKARRAIAARTATVRAALRGGESGGVSL